MDNYGTHKTALIRNWLAKRPRFHVHFTPTYGSWLNLVERWFAELTNKQLRRGAHRSVAQLEAAIREFIDAHHANPKPFVWTKTADEILAVHGSICSAHARFSGRTGRATYCANHAVRTLVDLDGSAETDCSRIPLRTRSFLPVEGPNDSRSSTSRRSARPACLAQSVKKQFVRPTQLYNRVLRTLPFAERVSWKLAIVSPE